MQSQTRSLHPSSIHTGKTCAIEWDLHNLTRQWSFNHQSSSVMSVPLHFKLCLVIFQWFFSHCRESHIAIHYNACIRLYDMYFSQRLDNINKFYWVHYCIFFWGGGVYFTLSFSFYYFTNALHLVAFSTG